MRLHPERPKDGQSIAVSGYPFKSLSLLTNSGVLSTAWLREQFIMKQRRTDNERYLGDLTVNGGNSGGPVYLAETGAVIGVCVAHIAANVLDRNQKPLDVLYNSGIAEIVPIKYAIPLLEKYNVRWLKAVQNNP